MTPRRQQSDSAILNAAYLVTFDTNSDVVKKASFVYIGLRSNYVPVFAQKTACKAVDKYVGVFQF